MKKRREPACDVEGKVCLRTGFWVLGAVQIIRVMTILHKPPRHNFHESLLGC
jgi:hypothetical protein